MTCLNKKFDRQKCGMPYSAEVLAKTGHRRVHIVESEGTTELVRPDPNTNLNCTKTVISMAVYHMKKGKNVLETEFWYVKEADNVSCK